MNDTSLAGTILIPPKINELLKFKLEKKTHIFISSVIGMDFAGF